MTALVRRKGRLQLGDVDVVGRQGDIDKNRHGAVLDDRRHGGRESRRRR